MLKLYGIPLSPLVRKALLAIELKELDYQLEMVTPMMKPEGFEKISPLGKIPAIVDDNGPLADSSVICEYLEDRYPEVSLYPADPAEKAKARWLEEYADTVLLKVTGADLFFERVVKPMMGQETDEEKVQANLKDGLPKALGYLESLVPEQGFFFGEKIMVADVSLASHFINARYAGFETSAEAYPKFVAYLERVLAHPALQHRLAEDQKIMSRS